MLSDNGTNHVGTERDPRQEMLAWDEYKIRGSLFQQGIDWQFHPPAASHLGEGWERLIRNVRKILHTLMRPQMAKFDEYTLMAVFCEA